MSHPFITCDLRHPVNVSLSTQTLIADFRARGGQLPKKPHWARRSNVNMDLVREIVLPTPRLIIEPDALPLNDLREQLKSTTVRGFDFLSLILERLCSIKQEVSGTEFEQTIVDLLSQEKVDRDFFRDMIENCQIELCHHSDPIARITIQVSKNCILYHLLIAW